MRYVLRQISDRCVAGASHVAPLRSQRPLCLLVGLMGFDLHTRDVTSGVPETPVSHGMRHA